MSFLMAIEKSPQLILRNLFFCCPARRWFLDCHKIWLTTDPQNENKRANQGGPYSFNATFWFRIPRPEYDVQWTSCLYLDTICISLISEWKEKGLKIIQLYQPWDARLWICRSLRVWESGRLSSWQKCDCVEGGHIARDGNKNAQGSYFWVQKLPCFVDFSWV